MNKTWTLTLTPPGAEADVRTGLSYQETREALRSLMYGDVTLGADAQDRADTEQFEAVAA
jgi:hypothetical protein